MVGSCPPEVVLWVAVIVQMISDSRMVASNKTVMNRRRNAREWLTKPSHDLHWILIHIGIDIEYWHQRVVPTLRRQWAHVNGFRLAEGGTAGWRYGAAWARELIARVA
jgi:hypothetical protein